MRTQTNLSCRIFWGLVCATSAVGAVQAGDIYKSIDANGNVVYSDQLVPSTSHSTVVQLEDPRFPPQQLHFCWTNCFTLILENGVYRRIDGTDESWTVATFSPSAVVLHRRDSPADWNGYSQDVVYAGRVSNDRLIGVTVNEKPISGIDASWGAALNTLPGSNAERDAKDTANTDSSSTGIVSSATAPPPIPEEDQPALSEDGLLWTPGYWYWRNPGYFWTPGVWVRPPHADALWTPAYWGVNGSVFVFHPGHWGSSVGFYGGVNYGNGYFGNGYAGGHWIGNSFAYNSVVNRLNPAVVHRTYAESTPNIGLQSVSSYSAASRRSASTGTPTEIRSSFRSVTTQASTVERTADRAPKPAEADKSATVAKTPSHGVPPKSVHVVLARTAPPK